MRRLVDRALWWGLAGALAAHGVLFGLAGVALTPAEARAVESAEWWPHHVSYWQAHFGGCDRSPLRPPPTFEPWNLPWRTPPTDPLAAFLEEQGLLQPIICCRCICG